MDPLQPRLKALAERIANDFDEINRSGRDFEELIVQAILLAILEDLGGTGTGSGITVAQLDTALVDLETGQTQTNNLLTDIRAFLQTQVEFDSLFVLDTNSGIYYERRHEIDESTGTRTTLYFTLADPVNPVTLGAGAVLVPGSGSATGNTVDVAHLVGSDAAVNVTPGQIIDKITLLDPDGVVLGVSFVDAFTGAVLVGVLPSDVETLPDDTEQLLQQILTTLDFVYVSIPVVVLAAVGDEATLDTTGLGTTSHHIGALANGFGAGETITIRALCARSMTDEFFPIGPNFEFILSQDNIFAAIGSHGGKPFIRVELVDNSTAAGTVTIDLDASKGGGGI